MSAVYTREQLEFQARVNRETVASMQAAEARALCDEMVPRAQIEAEYRGAPHRDERVCDVAIAFRVLSPATAPCGEGDPGEAAEIRVTSIRVDGFESRHEMPLEVREAAETLARWQAGRR